MSKIKTAALILIIGSLVIEVVVQKHAIDYLRTQVVDLASGSHELEALRVENNRLKSQAVNGVELVRVRKAELELMRLRNQKGAALKTSRPAPGTNTPASNTPDKNSAPLQTFKANVKEHVGGGGTLVLGGWLADNGKRILLFVTPSISDETPYFTVYQIRAIETEDDVLAATGLDSVRGTGQMTSVYKTLSKQEADSALTMLTSTRASVLTFPIALVKDGTTGSFSVGDSAPVSGSSETVVLGPTVKLKAIRSADGSSFDLTVDAELNMAQNSPQ